MLIYVGPFPDYQDEDMMAYEEIDTINSRTQAVTIATKAAAGQQSSAEVNYQSTSN